MSHTYYIQNTASSDSFLIKPGELDGPLGSATHTDLRLYGFGASQWGEGVNENLYRLLENFACPETTSGGELIPQTPTDLGPGNGIVAPVLGQTWFNTDQEILFVYTSAGWVSTQNTFVTFDGSSGTAVITTSSPSVTVVRQSQGVYNITFPGVGTRLPAITSTCVHANDNVIVTIRSLTSTTAQIYYHGLINGPVDPTHASVTIVR